MSTSTIQVGCNVRPVRLAFALPEPEDALARRVFRINSALWGGFYNPIFVVHGKAKIVNEKYAKFTEEAYQQQILEMLKEFDPDFVVNYCGKPLEGSLAIFNHRTIEPSQLKWNPWGREEVSNFVEVWSACWLVEGRIQVQTS